MASFQQEKELVGHLLRRLNLGLVCVCDPNADGSETGVDVLVHLPDRRQHSFESVDEVWLLRSDAKSTHHSESSGNDAGRQRVLV